METAEQLEIEGKTYRHFAEQLEIEGKTKKADSLNRFIVSSSSSNKYQDVWQARYCRGYLFGYQLSIYTPESFQV